MDIINVWPVWRPCETTSSVPRLATASAIKQSPILTNSIFHAPTLFLWIKPINAFKFQSITQIYAILFSFTEVTGLVIHHIMLSTTSKVNQGATSSTTALALLSRFNMTNQASPTLCTVTSQRSTVKQKSQHKSSSITAGSSSLALVKYWMKRTTLPYLCLSTAMMKMSP